MKRWILVGGSILALIGVVVLAPKKTKRKEGLSSAFKKVHFADRAGSVLGVKDINIRGVTNPYNPSIVAYKDHYLMTFRYDIPLPKLKHKIAPFFTTNIGIVELDQNFEQTEQEFIVIDTGSKFAEDARLFAFQGKYHILYNDRVTSLSEKEIRTMHLAELNENDFSVKWTTNLDQQIKAIEKNWVPIVHKENEQEKLLLGYSINPHKILGVENLHSNELRHFAFPGAPNFYSLDWWKWGDPRGGTPAVRVGDEYLAFFHSFFKDEKNTVKYWYVMGAYTFEAKEPFRLTRFSKVPFLFSSIYGTKISSDTVDPAKRVAYPSGFVQGVYQGRDVFFVSVGDNDCAIKILIVDKENLYRDLKKVF